MVIVIYIYVYWFNISEGTIMRYKMIIQYDGSKFHGFQRQKGYNSIQETLEITLTEILKTPVVIKGAGRTDAGVHAVGQVVHFDSPQLVPEKNLKKIVNKKVYPNIYIKSVEYVDETFHSRVSSTKKEYRYYVSLNEFSPFKSEYLHFFHNNIDLDKIRKAMTYIEGTHDFKSFSKNHVIKNTVRTIELFELNVEDNILEFRIVGTGFMYNMVRIIVALMLKVGEGKFQPEHIKDVIEGKDRKFAPYVAPPQGLYLWKVYYE